MNCKEISFSGKEAIEIQTGALGIVIVTECGPRIAFWGRPQGENLLFWDNKVTLERNQWKLMGGHRVWATRPGADESEDAYREDNRRCEIKCDTNSITVTGAKDPVLQTRRGIQLKLLADNRISVDNFIINDGNLLYSGGVWALTCTNPAPKRKYGIPLGDGSTWDCFRLVMFRKWGANTSSFNDSQISFTEDMLLLDPQGKETKRMLEAPYGIIAMDVPDQNTTFVKRTDYRHGADYPLGCNLAFYVGADNFMVEMESMGAEIPVKPGQAVHSTETWLLTDEALGLNSAQTLLDLY